MTDSTNRSLNTCLWTIKAILCITLLMSGSLKVFKPIETLIIYVPWAADSHFALVRLTGLAELLGGLGLIIPSYYRTFPQLTVYAAISLALLMISSIVFHINRGEQTVIGSNFIILFFSIFIAWGRGIKLPIKPKN